VTNAIHILNASHLSSEDLRPVAATVENTFHLPSTVEGATLDVERAFDESRGQYNSGALLAELLGRPQPPGTKRIAIVDVDLFIPVLTFIFGEAQFEGPTAIVSTYRLSNEFYGLTADHPVLMQRLAKEIIHELGHTFGLFHCRQFECVMRSSTYVEEIDLKGPQFCTTCGKTIEDSNTITVTKKDR
jgi:archaemetzincin